MHSLGGNVFASTLVWRGMSPEGGRHLYILRGGGSHGHSDTARSVAPQPSVQSFTGPRKKHCSCFLVNEIPLAKFGLGNAFLWPHLAQGTPVLLGLGGGSPVVIKCAPCSLHKPEDNMHTAASVTSTPS